MNFWKKKLERTSTTGYIFVQKKQSNISFFYLIFNRKSVVYDGKIILIIEGLESFRDYETRNESNIKFWLPKCFPKNVKVIVTASKESKSYKYLESIGSEIINLRLDPIIIKAKISSMQNRKFFVKESQKNKIFDIVYDKLERKLIKTVLYSRLIASCFCPYETPTLLESGDVDKEKLADILDTVDYNE